MQLITESADGCMATPPSLHTHTRSITFTFHYSTALSYSHSSLNLCICLILIFDASLTFYSSSDATSNSNKSLSTSLSGALLREGDEEPGEGGGEDGVGPPLLDARGVSPDVEAVLDSKNI